MSFVIDWLREQAQEIPTATFGAERHQVQIRLALCASHGPAESFHGRTTGEAAS